MLISTLLIIPWVILGFRHPDIKFIGLNQTKKSLLTLLIIEIIFWLILYLSLDKPDPNFAEQGSFAWMYMFIYEKGIIPLQIPAETIDGYLGDKIDNKYQFLYLITALIVDYILLKLISPQTIRHFKRTSPNT
ncbi:MAG TPA: hypothetical protein VL859_00140 [Flavobacterium sp.]|nr:hypothetical protein [Flavobacterium sp.]